jgi:hypothetical protein
MLRGERAPPKMPLSVIFIFCCVIKSLFLSCFPAQLQGRTGDTPKGKASSLVDKKIKNPSLLKSLGVSIAGFYEYIIPAFDTTFINTASSKNQTEQQLTNR